MKYTILFITLGVLLFFISILADLEAQSVSLVQEGTIARDLSVKEFDQLLKSSDNAVLLDVRTPGEIAQGYLTNAIFLDYYKPDFKEKLAELDKANPILIYCHSGWRSDKAMKMLGKLGFSEVYNLESGIVGWRSAGMPIVK
jgi:rhodanese-related sulfurtransferase